MALSSWRCADPVVFGGPHGPPNRRWEEHMQLPLGLNVLVLLLLLASPVTDLLAQGSPWGIGLEVGLTRFWGGSEPVAPNDAPGLKPYRPTTVGLRIDRSFRRYRLGLGVQYAASAI